MHEVLIIIIRVSITIMFYRNYDNKLFASQLW